MKKTIIFILIGLLLSSCSNNDDNTINCATFDPFFPELYIRLVDETGNNLIENGTIEPNDITVEGDFPNPLFRLVTPEDAVVEAFSNTLILAIPNQSIFRYTINLNDTDSIDIDFNNELIELVCDVSFFSPSAVELNGETIELSEIEARLFLVDIEL